MNKIALVALLSLIPLHYSLADDYCKDQNSDITLSTCKTAGAGAGVGAVSGIYAMKKYSTANSIEKEFTTRVFSNPNGTEARVINQTTGTFTDGDKITMQYQLSEAENRQYHIDLMTSDAASDRTAAALHGALALSAMTTETYASGTDSNGNTTYSTRSVPDYAMRAAYGVMALHEIAEAKDYDAKAADARAGGAVPTYTLDKVIDQKQGTAQASAAFVNERVTDHGGKIISIDRLPVEKFTLVKSAIVKARGGLVGVALGAGLAIEEVAAHTLADKIDATAYKPQMQPYSADSNGAAAQ